MTKKQKVLSVVFGAMFLVPEILFSTTLSLIKSILGKSFFDISSILVNYELFLDHPFYLIVILLVEFLGVLGLLFICFKNRKVLAIFFFGLITLWLLCAIIFVYTTGISMSLF